MTTLNQNVRQKIKRVKPKYSKTFALQKNPQKAGVCHIVMQRPPKKPCSARRMVAFIRLNTGFYIATKLVGEIQDKEKAYTISKFARVLVRGGRTLDLPGMKYKLEFTRNAKFNSLRPLDFRYKSRSKYGNKNYDRIKEVRKDRKRLRFIKPRLKIFSNAL